MKIALAATEKLPVPAIRGGAIQIYLDSVASIIGKTADVSVISIKDPELKESEERNNVKYLRFDEDSYLEQLTTHVKNAKYDVVHICNRPTWIKTLAEASPETKFVLSVHNDMFAPDKISDQEGMDCISLVAKIITVSDYIGNTITSRFPDAQSKTKTVYSGVDLEDYHPQWTAEGSRIRRRIRDELGLEGRKVVLFVGRLSKVKGPHVLLQAMPKIIEEHPDIMMVFVGSKWFGDDNVNNYVKHLYTFGSLYLENVTFIKFVKPRDIPGLYTMSDLFVCSSQWQEPLARVHYEAMAAGLPIITSNRGGNPEVIEEEKNGFIIYDFENPDAYAIRINQLLSNTNLCQRLGKYGRAKVERDFGWETVSKNLISVYKEAMRYSLGRKDE
ncbi:glycosyltransferase family 4 protein [Bacillus methanolicus]|uniref:Spore coat protein SA n=1 Tax=Bacillus methanolicus (strain MGA3 / ATCC 53907) TaxID=796606 RepID=I3E7X8_BACMM|nr:glycosyltransferase family 4 protein [Bacillus methanolicus]AIE59414.1 Spore coat protein SA [Bacillus methanolicus MGA3]EIJ82599.1 glycosyl transferase group 1 [Bacillus methanolicus MGA3]